MALSTFDVDASVVMKHLAQADTSNATRPGTTDITNEWIPRAGADIDDAALEGGLDFSGVDSSDTPIAYYQLRHLLALRAALYHLMALGHQVIDEEGPRGKAWAATKDKLAEIRSGQRIGEVTSSGAANYAENDWGDDTVDDIDDERAAWDDPL